MKHLFPYIFFGADALLFSTFMFNMKEKTKSLLRIIAIILFIVSPFFA